LQAFFGHTIKATKVAPVGHRQAQIIDLSSVIIL
jgi:hypothetical protein